MQTILLVTHCYAVRYPHFAAFLRYQLQSVCLLAPVSKVRIQVFYAIEDERTCEVLEEFAQYQEIVPTRLEPRRLWRRSIGRNIAARRSREDIVWFTDCDHVFGPGCLSALLDLEWQRRWVLVYPNSLMINKTHAIGDDYAQRVRTHFADDDFELKRYNRAIGGVQIVKGETVRRIGYADMEKWQTPVDQPFPDFKDDLAFRSAILEYGDMQPIELPNLYRLRHSETTYQAPVKPR